MKKHLLAALSLCAFMAAASLPAHAMDEAKPDDQVVFSLSSESWVTTKTAKITVGVEAAVTSNTAGTMRTTMTKAVNDLVKADWRMTGLNRNQDQTGMERWSASFETRIPESELNNLNETAKKLSKPGMQLSVRDVDFSPTMEEVQAARSQLRSQIYKMAVDQLTALNAAIPNRGYRISSIDFTEGAIIPRPHMVKTMAMRSEMAAANADMASPEMERSEKLFQNARVVLAALPQMPAKTDNK